MPRPALKDGLSKHARYRAAKKAAGLTEGRPWTFDRKNPEFLTQPKRDMEARRASPGEAMILRQTCGAVVGRLCDEEMEQIDARLALVFGLVR